MKDYIKAINALVTALHGASFRDLDGDEVFKLSAAVSKILELAKKIETGDIDLVSKTKMESMPASKPKKAKK